MGASLTPFFSTIAFLPPIFFLILVVCNDFLIFHILDMRNFSVLNCVLQSACFSPQCVCGGGSYRSARHMQEKTKKCNQNISHFNNVNVQQGEMKHSSNFKTEPLERVIQCIIFQRVVSFLKLCKEVSEKRLHIKICSNFLNFQF